MKTVLDYKFPEEVKTIIENKAHEAYQAHYQAAQNKSWDKGDYGKIMSYLRNKKDKTLYYQNLASRALRGAYAVLVYLTDYYIRHQEIPPVNIVLKDSKCDIDSIDREYGKIDIKFGVNQFTTDNDKKNKYIKEKTGIKYQYVVLADKSSVPGHERKYYTRGGVKYPLYFLTDPEKFDYRKAFHLQHHTYLEI